VLAELRESFRTLRPELDDHVFTVEVEQWVSHDRRVRRRKDPKKPASDQALMRMVWRVCKRAGVRSLSPHQLRHGFANRFLRESGRDVVALQALMGHRHPDTTQQLHRRSAPGRAGGRTGSGGRKPKRTSVA
jgi:integrase